MATLFVKPLMACEAGAGYATQIVNSTAPAGEGETLIGYDLTPANLLRLPLAFARICALLRRERPALVISHNSKSSLLPLLAARLMRVPNIVYFNHGVPFIAYRGLVCALMQLLERLNCLLAHQVLTVSTDMKRILDTFVPPGKVSIINRGSACGIDLAVFRRELYGESTFRRDQGIAADDFVTVFIGRAELRKGIGLALDLWREHFSTRPGYRLLLCGASADEVCALYGEVPTQVTCLGFCPNIAEVLSSANSLILPSQHEGMPYAVLEAMACGCVPVVNDIEGIRCLVENGVNGFLVRDNAPQAYVYILTALRERPQPIPALRVSAVVTAAGFARDRFLAVYLERLRALIGHGVGG